MIEVRDKNFGMLRPIMGVIKSLGMVTFLITGVIKRVITAYFKILFFKTHYGRDAHDLDHSKAITGVMMYKKLIHLNITVVIHPLQSNQSAKSIFSTFSSL